MPANLLTATTPTVQAATTTNQTTATAQTTQSGTTGQTGMMQNSQNGMEDQFCCMVSMTNEDLQILTNFIEDELYDQRYYQAFAHQAPGWARKTLMDFSVTEGAHAHIGAGISVGDGKDIQIIDGLLFRCNGSGAMALDEVKQSRVRFRTVSASKMQEQRAKLDPKAPPKNEE